MKLGEKIAKIAFFGKSIFTIFGLLKNEKNLRFIINANPTFFGLCSKHPRSDF